MARVEGRSDAAPAPAGPYSQAVRIGDMVACAGQVGLTPDGTALDGVTAQTRQALDNVVAALGSLGCTLDDVLHTRVYLTRPDQFDEMNTVYAEYFEPPYPARTTVFVTLPADFLVEIDVLAVPASRAKPA